MHRHIKVKISYHVAIPGQCHNAPQLRVCVAYLLLGLVLGPGSLAVLLAEGLRLLVVQQGVVLMVAHQVVLEAVQQLSQDRVLWGGGNTMVNDMINALHLCTATAESTMQGDSQLVGSS